MSELGRKADELAEQLTRSFPVPFVLVYRIDDETRCTYLGNGSDLLEMAERFARVLRDGIRTKEPSCNVCGHAGAGFVTPDGERCALVGCQGWMR